MARLNMLARQHLLLPMALIIAAILIGGNQSPMTRPAVWEAPAPSPTPPPPPGLERLLTINRDAAARVALIALVETDRRGAMARRTARYLADLGTHLPSIKDYTDRQRAILHTWQQALNDYTEGKPGALARIRAASEWNIALYLEMIHTLQPEGGLTR